MEAAQRDRSRFAELYEQNFERVYAYVARRVPRRQEAEEVTSEVFHQALENLGRFEWRGAPLAAWLYRIAANAIADRWRRAAREAEGLIEFVKQAFGAEGQTYGLGSAGGVHAEYRIGDTTLMLGGGVAGREFRGEAMPTMFFLYVEDCDAWYRRALEAGATSIHEPGEQPYGARVGEVRDPFGNRWNFATPIPGRTGCDH